MTGIAQFMTAPELLGRDFAGHSWDSWRVTLKATFGERMTAAERARFRELAERDPPAKRVREAWFAIGRRAGKDSVASAIAIYMAVSGDFARYLRRGERAVILCLAVDRTQAGIVFNYIRAAFEETALLRPLIQRVGSDEVQLTNGVDIVVGTNTFRGIRGRTVACAIFDEVAYWRDETSANPDREVYSALVPSLATLRRAGAMIVAISTTYRRTGLLFEKWQKHHGKDDDRVLVIRQPAEVYNPNLRDDPELAAEIAEDLERDPERAASEWLSEWRTDLADFVNRAVVEQAVIPGRHELAPVSGQHYVSFVDPSGAVADSMTLAIAHKDKDGRAILDLVREVRPPFSPEGICAEFAALSKRYHAHGVTGDHWGGEWPREQFEKHGVGYDPSDKTKSAIYLEFLPLLNSGRTKLLDNPRLIAQLCALERATARGGRNSIDHPPGAHDDLVNAAAGALVLATTDLAIHVPPAAMARIRAMRPGRYGDPHGRALHAHTRAAMQRRF